MHFTRLAATIGGVLAAGWLALAVESTYATTFNQSLDAGQDLDAGEEGSQVAEMPANKPANTPAEPSGGKPSMDVLTPLIVSDPVPAASAPAARLRPVLRLPATTRLVVVAPGPATPTGAEIVGRLLTPGASDPDVPMPHPELAGVSAGNSAVSEGPRLFGRAESGDGVLDIRGGVFGFTVPIPADRSAPSPNTRSSLGLPALQMGPKAP
jgi:hypothetical protein